MDKRTQYFNVDLTGQKFYNLTAITWVEGTRSKWLFECDCGNTIVEKPNRVINGWKQSCGCKLKQAQKAFVERNTRHGETKTRLHHIWSSMLARCYNKNNNNYKRYGGRGIAVCNEWKDSYECFRDWAYSVGYDEKVHWTFQSIDRIDIDGDYSPDNCKWSDIKTQAHNRSTTYKIAYNGKEYNPSTFSDAFGITDKSFVYRRLRSGQPIETILSDWNEIHNVPSGLIEVSVIAKERNVTEAHVKRLLNDGKIKGRKVGRKWYVYRKEQE